MICPFQEPYHGSADRDAKLEASGVTDVNVRKTTLQAVGYEHDRSHRHIAGDSSRRGPGTRPVVKLDGDTSRGRTAEGHGPAASARIVAEACHRISRRTRRGGGAQAAGSRGADARDRSEGVPGPQRAAHAIARVPNGPEMRRNRRPLGLCARGFPVFATAGHQIRAGSRGADLARGRDCHDAPLVRIEYTDVQYKPRAPPPPPVVQERPSFARCVRLAARGLQPDVADLRPRAMRRVAKAHRSRTCAVPIAAARVFRRARYARLTARLLVLDGTYSAAMATSTSHDGGACTWTPMRSRAGVEAIREPTARA